MTSIFSLFPTLLLLALVTMLVVHKRERRRRARASAEAERIDAMRKDGKITEQEAEALKSAVGFVSLELRALKPDGHVKAVGYLHILVGLLGILLVFVFVNFFSFASSQQFGMGLQFAPSVMPLLVGVSLIVCLLELVIGAGLLGGRGWARLCVIVLSILYLFSVPIGTVLGGYSLWVLLMRERAADYFN